jgi:hypothetical protein
MIALINMQYRFCMMSCERLKTLNVEMNESEGGLSNQCLVYPYISPSLVPKVSLNLFPLANYLQHSDTAKKNEPVDSWPNDPTTSELFKFTQGPALVNDSLRSMESSRLFPIVDGRSTNESKFTNMDLIHNPSVKYLDSLR